MDESNPNEADVEGGLDDENEMDGHSTGLKDGAKKKKKKKKKRGYNRFAKELEERKNVGDKKKKDEKKPEEKEKEPEFEIVYVQEDIKLDYSDPFQRQLSKVFECFKIVDGDLKDDGKSSREDRKVEYNENLKKVPKITEDDDSDEESGTWDALKDLNLD